jgi:hypothetical protein
MSSKVFVEAAQEVHHAYEQAVADFQKQHPVGPKVSETLDQLADNWCFE